MNTVRISTAVLSEAAPVSSMGRMVRPHTGKTYRTLHIAATMNPPDRDSTKHDPTTSRTYSGMKTDWGPPLSVTIAVMSTASRENWNQAMWSDRTLIRSATGSTRQAATPPRTVSENGPNA